MDIRTQLQFSEFEIHVDQPPPEKPATAKNRLEELKARLANRHQIVDMAIETMLSAGMPDRPKDGPAWFATHLRLFSKTPLFYSLIKQYLRVNLPQKYFFCGYNAKYMCITVKNRR